MTQSKDAAAAYALGVDAIGLVFYPDSSRAVTADQATTVLAGLPDTMQVYALFVDPTVAEVEAALTVGRIDHLQFHGSEDSAFCAAFGLPYMKACRVRDVQSTLREIEQHQAAEYILLDRYEQGAPGGTGKTFDWELAATIVRSTDKPIVLAGGLHPGNVAAAINQVRPFGVDVSSGVEHSRGSKDASKMQLFVEGVRSAKT